MLRWHLLLLAKCHHGQILLATSMPAISKRVQELQNLLNTVYGNKDNQAERHLLAVIMEQLELNASALQAYAKTPGNVDVDQSIAGLCKDFAIVINDGK